MSESELQSAKVLREIAYERQRQVHQESHTRAKDDDHAPGVLARAGAAYAFFAALGENMRNVLTAPECEGSMTRVLFARLWPWPLSAFKPKEERRRELVIAASLIVAEIEKIDRAAPGLARTPERGA